MKTNKSVLIIFLSVLIFSCSGEKPEKVRTDFTIPTIDKIHLNAAKDAKAKLRVKKLFTYDNNKQEFVDTKKIGERIFFNENSEIDSVIRYNTYGEVHTKWVYFYDENNNLIQMDSYDSPTRLAMVREMEFDENGNEIKRQERRLGKGTISFEYRSYNDFGQKTKERIEDQEGELLGEEEYIYEDFLLREIQNKNINGDILGRRVYSYDENGNIISSQRMRDGETLSEIKYEYDKNNNIIKIDYGFYYSTFSYDDSNRVKSEQNYLKSGDRQKKHLFNYTENGLLKEIVDYSPLDEPRYKFVFEYEFH